MKAIHPEALTEYKEAAKFYKARRAGLGVSFVEEIEDVFTRIVRSPTQWSLVERGVRQCLAKRFPYRVIYTVSNRSVLIVAVAHNHREPGYWRTRLPRPEQDA